MFEIMKNLFKLCTLYDNKVRCVMMKRGEEKEIHKVF